MILTRQTIQFTQNLVKRNYGVSAVLLNKATDPIQQLFLDKIREYASKSKGHLFFDASPAIEKEYSDEITKARRQYGGVEDVTKFPEFRFEEPVIEIHMPKATKSK